MKRERLYGITIYLLNHGRTSAKTLAEYFEVSVRTIQRDMDALSMAKIPIIAYPGSDGGYEIQEGDRLDEQWVNEEEFSMMATALQGYSSAMGENQVVDLCEKIEQLSKDDSHILLDFSVLQEHPLIYQHLQIIKTAMLKHCCLRFMYTNARNERKKIVADAAGCMYKWYAWYMIAKMEKGYRMYKLVRMEDIELVKDMQAQPHPALREIIASMHDEKHQQPMIEIRLRCDKAKKLSILEYLPGEILQEDKKTFLYRLYVPKDEHFWYANLLAFGDRIEVLQPITLRKRIYEDSKRWIQLYQEL